MAGYPIRSFALPSRRNDKALRREFYADAKQKNGGWRISNHCCFLPENPKGFKCVHQDARLLSIGSASA